MAEKKSSKPSKYSKYLKYVIWGLVGALAILLILPIIQNALKDDIPPPSNIDPIGNSISVTTDDDLTGVGVNNDDTYVPGINDDDTEVTGVDVNPIIEQLEPDPAPVQDSLIVPPEVEAEPEPAPRPRPVFKCNITISDRCNLRGAPINQLFDDSQVGGPLATSSKACDERAKSWKGSCGHQNISHSFTHPASQNVVTLSVEGSAGCVPTNLAKVQCDADQRCQLIGRQTNGCWHKLRIVDELSNNAQYTFDYYTNILVKTRYREYIIAK